MTQKCSQAWEPWTGWLRFLLVLLFLESSKSQPNTHQPHPGPVAEACLRAGTESPSAFKRGPGPGHLAHGLFLPVLLKLPSYSWRNTLSLLGPQEDGWERIPWCWCRNSGPESRSWLPVSQVEVSAQLTLNSCLPGLGLPAPENPGILPPQLPVSFPAFLLHSPAGSRIQSTPLEKFQPDLALCGGEEGLTR